MWTYEDATGKLFHDGVLVATGYSGLHEDKNNPAAENVKGMGPIPEGRWSIGAPVDTTEHGPYVLRLTALPETQTFGRSGFLIHGDSPKHPGEASQGCIVMPHDVRVKIWESGDHDLTVASGPKPPEVTANANS